MLVIKQNNYNLYISLGLSFALYVLGFTAFLFVLPLLLFYAKSGQRNQTLISLTSLLVLVLLYELFPLRGDLQNSTSVGLLSIGLFLPIVLIGSSIIWVFLDSYRLLVRYVASCIFIGAFVAIVGFWFKVKPELLQSIDATIIKIVESFFGTSQVAGNELSLNMGVSSTEIYSLVRATMVSMIVPFGAGVFGLNAFFSIANSGFSDSEKFDSRVASWKIPEPYVWIFLASWLVILLGVFVDYNNIITIVCLNLALLISMIYAVQGLAIILSWFRSKDKKIGAVKLFTITAAIIILLQGLNIVFVIGLPILGVTETWFTYRK